MTVHETVVDKATRKTLDSLSCRKSTRVFESGAVLGKNSIEEIVRDGVQAPSSCNHQMWHFVAVTDQELKSKLQSIAGANEHFIDCSVLLVACFQKGWNHSKFAVVQSSAAAIYHMSLSAHLRGYGSIWNAGIGRKKKIAKLLNIPAKFEIIGTLCIGVIGEGVENKPPRRKLSDILSWQTFYRSAESLYPLKNAAQYPFHKISVHNNPFAVHDPLRWKWEQIGDFRSYAVYAKSPLEYTYVGRRFGKELAVEVEQIPKSSSNVLEVMPFGGQRTSRILRHIQSSEVHIAELNERSKQFIVDRLSNEGFESVAVSWYLINKGKIHCLNESFDSVFMAQVIDAVPDKHILIKEALRVLKPGGHLVITFRNLLSWYGLYYIFVHSRKQVTNYGPWKPLVLVSVLSILKSLGVRSTRLVGLSPSPNKAGESVVGIRKYFCKTLVLTVVKDD